MSRNDATLQSLAITDFRSIRGTAVIPLDAPVVLLHGQNGAGKTSVMSALELALNGQYGSLLRAGGREGRRSALMALVAR